MVRRKNQARQTDDLEHTKLGGLEFCYLLHAEITSTELIHDLMGYYFCFQV